MLRVDLAQVRQEFRRRDALPGLELPGRTEELNPLIPGIARGVAALGGRPVERFPARKRPFLAPDQPGGFPDLAQPPRQRRAVLVRRIQEDDVPVLARRDLARIPLDQRLMPLAVDDAAQALKNLDAALMLPARNASTASAYAPFWRWILLISATGRPA